MPIAVVHLSSVYRPASLSYYSYILEEKNMGVIKNAIRRPIVTTMTTMIVAIAIAVLCIGVGQSSAAINTVKTLDYNHTTVALPTAKFQYSQSNGGYAASFSVQLPEEIANWITQTATNYPGIVKSVSSPGLASAYASDLVLDNYTDHDYNELTFTNISYFLQPAPEGMPYSCAMLEIVLTEVGKPVQQYTSKTQADGTRIKVESSIRVSLEGTISSVIGLQEGYSNPTGFTAHITLILPDTAALDALNLVHGEKYLVFGMDYCDTDWQLRNQIETDDHYGNIEVDQFDPNAISYLSAEQIEQNKAANPANYTVAYYNHNGKIIALDQYDIQKFRSITLTVEDKSALVEYTWTENEDGTLTAELLSTRSYVDANGDTVICTLEEYQQRYAIPTIIHVSNNADSLLSSLDGIMWKAALEHIQINSHAFPVVGVEKLGYIADFARETVRIVSGRDFTQDELVSGERVCIVSETLAAQNNLSVGDSIALQYYLYDWSSPYQKFISDGRGVVNPSAYFYTSTTELTKEVTYTVVGFYRQDNAWITAEDNLYSFTPNTIFVPQASVSGSMDYGNQAFFRTLVLKNGAIEQFQKLVVDAGYDGLFVYYDQGYSLIADSLRVYEDTAIRALTIGILGFCVLMTLYFLLFPFQQKKNIIIMDALGATRKTRIYHVVGSSLCILVPGTIIGIVISLCCWQLATDTLFSSTGIILQVDMNIAQLLLIGCAQFVIATLLSFAVAIQITKEQTLYRRK